MLAAVAVGLLLRSADLVRVFPADGSVRLGIDDSWFHARRALYSFAQFPHVLQFDWYLNYPHGAPAPCPPLFDWLIAAVARVFGDNVHTLEVVAAWVSPALGALLSIPAFWIGRSIAGTGVGIAAAWLVAVLPSGLLTTRVGNCDTPAAVALIAACWLASSLGEIGRSGRALARHALLHAAIVAILLLTWSGSLLYLALGEGARLGATVLLDGRPQRYFAIGASLALAGLPVLAWLLASQPPLGGPFTFQTLSWLHLIAVLSLAGLATGLGELERRRAARGAGGRATRAALAATCLAAFALLVPSIREALLHGVGFLFKEDVWAATNPEQAPLFTTLPASLVRHATTRFGFFAYLVPLTPLVAGVHLWRLRGDRQQRLLVFFCWVSVLSVLLLSQVRYGTDFTVPGAVAFALALGDVRSLLLPTLRRPAATGAVVAIGLVLVGPAWGWDARLFGEAAASWQRIRGAPPQQRLSSRDVDYLFAREVRQLTPETSGFLDAAKRPEYGILVPPALGHLFTYVSRRPVPADNLGPYLDLQSFREASDFYSARGASEGIDLLEKLGVRYVVTLGEQPAPRTFVGVLHRTYGSAVRNGEPTGRLRLVAQGPMRGSSLLLFSVRGWPRNRPRYELFELVDGAVLVVPSTPGAIVKARILLNTPLGTHPYVSVGRASPSGLARLRVPYPSGRSSSIRPGAVTSKGAWIVHTPQHDARVEVTETDVREGRDVFVHWPVDGE